MKKILLLTVILVGLTNIALATEEGKVSKVEKWDSDDWDAELAKMPKGSSSNGEKLANKGYCYTCHGEKGIAQTDNAPSLAGLTSPWIYKTLLDYKSGLFHIDNKSLVMQAAVKPMTKQDMSDLAVYYAAQKRPAGPGKIEAPKKLKKCQKCHDTGDEEDDDAPSLIGQSSQYIERQTMAYKHKVRRTEVGKSMYKAVRKLKNKKVKTIADYYADQ
jgi:cytochrome c553